MNAPSRCGDKLEATYQTMMREADDKENSYPKRMRFLKLGAGVISAAVLFGQLSAMISDNDHQRSLQISLAKRVDEDSSRERRLSLMSDYEDPQSVAYKEQPQQPVRESRENLAFYFPAARANNYPNLERDHALPTIVDPVNPPEGFPWHRWSADHINAKKFISILELVGSGRNPTEEMFEARKTLRNPNLSFNMSDPKTTVLTHPTPLLVREGLVLQPENRTDFESVLSLLLEDALALARHVQPFNPRMETLTKGEFPFLFDAYDYPFCGDDLVPIFRPNIIADDTVCQLAWPFVVNAYYLPRPPLELKIVPGDWDQKFVENDLTYPWEKKITKAVWRGTPTGLAEVSQTPRYKMVKIAMNYPSTMDIGFIPDPSESKDNPLYENMDERYIRPRMVQDDFMQYRAIVDIDGNAWSSRFGNLLCYNSVVLKVDAMYQAYFEKELRPWVHYIPVSADLSNLHHIAAYAVADANGAHVQEIIDNAHAWCRKNFLHHRMVEVLMWTLLAYVELLEQTADWYADWRANDVAYYMPALQMQSGN